MFTGLVVEIGRLDAVGDGRMRFGQNAVLEGLQVGDSIARSTALLTVTVTDDKTFTVEIMPETFAAPRWGDLHMGNTVNLERALTSPGRMGGA